MSRWIHPLSAFERALRAMKTPDAGEGELDSKSGEPADTPVTSFLVLEGAPLRLLVVS
jgi:hypothetical protein